MANEKKFEVAGGVSIVATGKKSVQVREEFEKQLDTVNAGTGSTLADMYDRFSKLLYVVDGSGSMGEGMLSEDTVNLYTWDAGTMERYRNWLREQMAAEKRASLDDEDKLNQDDELDEMAKEMEDALDAVLDPDDLSDEQLKQRIIMDGLESKSGIPLSRNYRNNSKSRTKMMAVKDAAKDFVHQRYQKYPEARVMLFSFEATPTLLAAGVSEEEVINGINQLPDFGGGSTDIYRAVDRAVRECGQRPSEVNAHHIVLVSDGCDYGARAVKDLLPRMKELGMVFDFIYILGASNSEAADRDVITALKDVCEATGGEFVTVKTEKDFVQKFLTASTRPMLPPCK